VKTSQVMEADPLGFAQSHNDVLTALSPEFAGVLRSVKTFATCRASALHSMH
jgi:hypothetical protein